MTPSAPPPLPGAGTTKNVTPPPPDYSTADCLNDVMSFLNKYVTGEGGSLGVDARSLVSQLLNYMQTNLANAVEVTFSIANAYHETRNFQKFTEGVSSTSAGYDGGSDYRGRGYIHLTGQKNYDAYFKTHLQRTDAWVRLWGARMFVPAYQPDEAADPQTALRIMTWYFSNKGTYGYLNKNDYLGARRTINPGESLNKHIWKGGPTIRQRITGLTSGLEPILKGC